MELLSLSLSDDDFFNLENKTHLKDIDDVKSNIVTSRFSTNDYKVLLDKSKKANMSISKFIKSAALDPGKKL